MRSIQVVQSDDKPKKSVQQPNPSGKKERGSGKDDITKSDKEKLKQIIKEELAEADLRGITDYDNPVDFDIERTVTGNLERSKERDPQFNVDDAVRIVRAAQSWSVNMKNQMGQGRSSITPEDLEDLLFILSGEGDYNGF